MSNPYQLTDIEVDNVKMMVRHEGFKALVQKVYPILKDSIINQILNPETEIEKIHALRGELRALNKFFQAPLTFLDTPKK